MGLHLHGYLGFVIDAVFAYSESKLTCHFVVVVVVVLVVLVVVLVLLGGKRSKKVGKRSKKVTSS